MQLSSAAIRYDWTLHEVQALYDQPFNDLLFQAHSLHRQYHDPNQLQLSTLLSIKTGACPEDCAYCPQSARYDTGVEIERLKSLEDVARLAKQAQENGATRFCMGAGWRNPKEKDFAKVLEMVKVVKEMGLETCVTLGMLTQEQVDRLEAAGLDFYNHNLDTSEDYYSKIISTRDYQDRLDTLEKVRCSNIQVCCGGIIGMGESIDDRLNLLIQLATMTKHPESVPINLLVPIPGTPLANAAPVDPIDFVRVIALARILMPKSKVRLSAGRTMMSKEWHALCYFAGANSIFYGEKYLATPLPDQNEDLQLLNSLGIKAEMAPCEA